MLARILFVDDDLVRAERRCEVLVASGCNACAATLSDALGILQTESIELVVLSVRLDHPKRELVISATGAERLLDLPVFTFPVELLQIVGERLRSLRGEEPVWLDAGLWESSAKQYFEASKIADEKTQPPSTAFYKDNGKWSFYTYPKGNPEEAGEYQSRELANRAALFAYEMWRTNGNSYAPLPAGK